MMNLDQALKQSLRLRLEKWHDFRRHIAFRCKVVFQYHLSNRGYFGKVLFNHHDGTLQLKVQSSPRFPDHHQLIRHYYTLGPN